MKYGITLLGERVSPRCSYADSIMLISQKRNGLCTPKRLPVDNLNMPDLSDLLLQNRVDVLVCGGITNENKEFLNKRNLDVIDNVIGTSVGVIHGLTSGELKAGYGLNHGVPDSDADAASQQSPSTITKETDTDDIAKLNCLTCKLRSCLDGKGCRFELETFLGQNAPSKEQTYMLDAATDIACESERTLCRLSELVYFCLEMRYRRIGIAYCVELEEPTEILAKILQRFFDVFPVCCKIGDAGPTDLIIGDPKDKDGRAKKHISCNPWGQAQVLNRLGTDFNIQVGLCMGSDCIFMQASHAPSTALFVKDRSLANNPIGAVYSEYYLKEASQARQ